MSTATAVGQDLVRPSLPGAPFGERDYRSLVGALFAVHRRVVVRLGDGAAGPMFCTCGDVWPCRNEELAATVLDFPL